MSSKTGSIRWSLAARISVWHAASMFLVLAVACGFLYWALVKSLQREDDEYLVEKISTIQTLLRDREANTRMIEWEVEGEAFAYVLTRVLDANGRVVIETTEMSAVLPPSAFPRTGGPETAVDIHAAGKTFRAASATGSSPSGYTVQVAIDLAREQALLAGHRRRLWLVLALGLLASVLIGYRIGHGGIRPVKEIASSIQHTTSATLSERMEIRGLPKELAALASTFNQMLDRLEEAFGRLSRFSSDIAHELRTPVNNIRLNAEVALSKARTPEEYRDVLAALLEELLRLTRLIDSLLFLARSENPQTQIHRERIRVRRELEAIREFYEAPASESGIALELDAPEDLEADLDRTLLQRAIGNLVENSLAHTPRGGYIRLAAEVSGSNLCLSVRDTGSGVPPEHLDHVFERFHRVDAARAKDSGGVGLGLAIVKSIAALHGGKAGIASAPGEGTRVELVFPLSK